MTDALVLDGVAHAAGDRAARQPVLARLDMTFPPGRFACLTGPSGAGKTTALSIMAGVVIPSHGAVWLGSRPISRLTDAERRAWRCRDVGLVFQTCRLIDVLTVEEHMMLVARLRGRPEAWFAGCRWLERLGLNGRLAHRPGQLSGGEKQRVALAQALAAAPAVVLADEPTAALDADNAAIVAGTLAAYASERGAIVVAVSHDAVMHTAAHDCLALAKPAAIAGAFA